MGRLCLLSDCFEVKLCAVILYTIAILGAYDCFGNIGANIQNSSYVLNPTEINEGL